MRYELRKVQALYADGGANGAARQALAALRGRLYRDEDHVVIVKDLRDGRPGKIGSNLEVRALDGHDADTVNEFCRRHFPPKVGRYVRSYRRRGYPAFAAFRDGVLIGLFWWVDDTIDAQHPDLILHEIHLQQGDAYSFAYFIAPEHRGSNTATEVIGAVFSALRDAGYTRVWGWVDSTNRPARWLWRLAGFQDARRVRVRTVLLLLALAERRVLIRNLGWRSRHAFGYRVLLA